MIRKAVIVVLVLGAIASVGLWLSTRWWQFRATQGHMSATAAHGAVFAGWYVNIPWSEEVEGWHVTRPINFPDGRRYFTFGQFTWTPGYYLEAARRGPGCGAS